MDNPKYSVIYCSKCESDKINLDQMKCMNCGNPFTDDDIQDLLKEAHQDHLKDLEAAKQMSDLDKFDRIAKRNGDIKCANLSTNFKRAQLGKNGFGEVTLAVDNETIHRLAKGQLIGGLYVTTIAEWKKESEVK